MPATRQYRHIQPAPRRGARGLAVLALLAGVAVVAGAVYLLFLRDSGPSARDALGTLLPTPDVLWRSLSPPVASVDASGVVRTVADGHARIVASVNGVADSISVDVLP